MSNTIVTEGEAANKWCLLPNSEGDRCGASQCMAWRWVEFNVVDDAFVEAVKKCAEEIGDTNPSRTKSSREVMENRERYGLPTAPTKGYCGLAGVPHDLPRVLRG